MRHAVEDDTPSNDRRVAGKRAVPELIAEYGDVIPSRRVLAGDEASAKCRTHAEDAHEVRGDAGSVETYRVAGTGKGELRGTERRDVLEGASLAMKCEIRCLIETGRHLEGSRRRSVRDEKESLRVGEGKGPQQDAVDDGEDGGVGADTEGQREQGDGGEAGCAAQTARGVAQVAAKAREPESAPHVARHLRDVGDVAELAPRGTLGVGPRLAARDAVGDRHLEVSANLLIELLAPLGAGTPRKLHGSASGRGCRKSTDQACRLSTPRTSSGRGKARRGRACGLPAALCAPPLPSRLAAARRA